MDFAPHNNGFAVFHASCPICWQADKRSRSAEDQCSIGYEVGEPSAKGLLRGVPDLYVTSSGSVRRKSVVNR